ncbi:hypothetical protein Peur_073104 [Populus x canadensis]
MKTIVANKRKVSILFYLMQILWMLKFLIMVTLGLSTAILDEPRGPRRLIMVRLPIVSRTFPLDACPPNFTPVEDPTFS